jgi:uncharacterized protein (TIGR03067 family)
MKYRALVLTAAVVLAAADEKEDANKKDLKALQGVWWVKWDKQDGKWRNIEELGGRWQLRIEISGRKLAYSIEPGTVHGTIELDATKKPPTIDVTFEEGTVMYGVYEVKGDTLKLCWTDKKGQERPKECDAKKGSPFRLEVLKRAKD